MGLRDFVNEHIMDLPSSKGGGTANKMAPPPQAAGPMLASMPTTSYQPMQATASYLDPDMVKDIQAVVARRATPFTQLEQSAASLAEVIPDEVTRFKAAFKLMPGTNAGTVISSIDFHIRDVEQEKQNFQTTSATVSQKKVATLRSEAEQLNTQTNNDAALIERLQQQVQQLHQGIAERSQVIAQKTAEANTAESDIQMKVSKFTAAADSVIATLKTKQTSLATMLS